MGPAFFTGLCGALQFHIKPPRYFSSTVFPEFHYAYILQDITFMNNIDFITILANNIEYWLCGSNIRFNIPPRKASSDKGFAGKTQEGTPPVTRNAPRIASILPGLIFRRRKAEGWDFTGDLWSETKVKPKWEKLRHDTVITWGRYTP